MKVLTDKELVEKYNDRYNKLHQQFGYTEIEVPAIAIKFEEKDDKAREAVMQVIQIEMVKTKKLLGVKHVGN